MSVKKAIIILMILAAAGGVILYRTAGRKPADVYTTFTVARGNIIQTVSETGAVKAPNEINLSFLNSGKIAGLNCQIGDAVEANAVLAELDCSGFAISKTRPSPILKSPGAISINYWPEPATKNWR